MNVRCLQIGFWLERRHSGLRGGQGLQLEEHLAQCADCRVQADRLDGLRRLIDSAPQSIGTHTRQRILRSALQSARRAPQATRPSRWTASAVGIAALAFTGLAAAAVAVWPELRSGNADRERSAHMRSTQAAQPLTTPAVAAEPASVVTPTSTGAAGAGSSRDEPVSTAMPSVVQHPHRARAAGLQPSAAELLRRARAELARGELLAAGTSIASALRAHPSRAERAEAASLQAECALVAGRSAEAQTLYLAVAERYAHSDAGDNALFAAARLAEQRSDPTSRALLRRYLEQYPQGRFRAEAERRLQRLVAP